MRLAGQAKAGFYPTPSRVVDMIAGLVYGARGSYRGQDVLRILDPCCGEGEAVAQLAEQLRQRSSVPIETFGVELHSVRAEEAAGRLDRALSTDLFQTSIGHGAFGLLYLNPPYDTDQEKRRAEHRFLTHCARYLAEDGLLVFIVPRRRLAVSARFLASHFWKLRCWAFPAPEREVFDQVVLIGYRRREPKLDEYALEKVREWSEGEPEELRSNPYPELDTATAPAGDVLFTTRTLDPVAAAAEARRSGLWTSAEVTDSLWPSRSQNTRPLMPLRRGHMAMLTAAGLPRQPLPTGGRTAHPGQGQDHEGEGARRVHGGDRDLPGAAAHHRGRPGPGRRRDHRHRGIAASPHQRHEAPPVLTWTSGASPFADLTNDTHLHKGKGEKEMNLSEFVDRYRDAIARRVVESYPPLYRPSTNGHRLPKLLRSPIGAQADAIRGTALSLRARRGTTVVGEMGTGKTLLAAAAAHMAGFRRILVVGPPHLMRKWKREVEETVPNARAAIVKSISDLEALRTSVGPGPLFAVMSRERAKLSYRWKPATVERWAAPAGRLLRDEETGEPIRVACCPACYSPIVDGEGVPLTDAQLSRRRHRCTRCGDALWQADVAGPRRYPLSDYVKHRMRGFFDLLVADEVHEFKGRGSAQGIAAGILADACGRSLTLTGTLLGGYASTLFHLLYRFSPEIRTEFGRSEEGCWISRYGFLEETVRRGDDGGYDEDGRSSRRRRYRKTVREKPGLAPAALFHLIGHSVFLRLSDVASDLPPYEEKVLLSSMDSEPDATELSQRKAYDKLFDTLRAALTEALAKGSKRLLATYLQSLLAYPDGCTRGETAFDPTTGDVLVQIPPLSDERLYPKEKALLDLVAAERLEGRRVLVYATHTGTRDVTGRMSDILTRHGFKVAVMKADAVAPDRREAWVAEKVKEGIDVLICHPRLVQTGLDLVDFPTICWMETDYSVYTMRQASRRSWRIGQTRPVRVVFMAYRNSLQADALKLVAKKLQSSLAVEGELPEDGLAAYGDDGDDLMLALARKIVNGEEGDLSADEAGEETVEAAFAQARDAEAVGEELLVDEGWHTVEPEPVEVHRNGTAPSVEAVMANGHLPAEEPNEAEADGPEQAVLTWAELFAQVPPKRNGRRKPPQPASLSLFEWAVQVEEEQVREAQTVS